MLIFAESHERIHRAGHHAHTFVNAYLRFLHDKPYGIIHEMRDDRNGVVKLVPQKTLARELPLVLGEFFYQLRSSLDAAMWQAFIHLGGPESSPDVREGRVDFPIYSGTSGFSNAAFHDIPLPNQLKLWLGAIQPCHAHKRSRGSAEDQLSIDLNLINECARKDRHRQLHIVGTVVSSSTALVKLSPPAQVTHVQSVPADPLHGQYEIAVFGADGLTAGTEIEVDANFTIHVAVREIPDDTDLMVRLFQLKDSVVRVVQKFEDLSSKETTETGKNMGRLAQPR